MQLDEDDFRFFKLLQVSFRMNQTGNYPGPVPAKEAFLKSVDGLPGLAEIMAVKYDFWVSAKRKREPLTMPKR